MGKFKDVFPLLFLFILISGCSNRITDSGKKDTAVTVIIDRGKTHQTIDGFGFFGARDVWWTGNQNNLITVEWARMIIEDLGVTIWRNEYYPPSTPEQGQDADWNKQKPVVEGIAAAAEAAGVDLKMIFTVWSPPADMKVAISDHDSWTGWKRLAGTPHPEGTKHGGALDPTMHEEFGHWLADGIQLYKDLGIDIYAISPQNEPFFRQYFNSCFYHPDWYAEMLENSIPVVRERFPDVRIFGAEGMLSMEAQPYFHHAGLMQPHNGNARDQLDIWAVHGYDDGVNPAGAVMDWIYNHETYAIPAGKPTWMTETSGYFDHWLSSGERAGALDLGLNIHAALKYGQVSAWVWWQGSQLGGTSEFSLMEGEVPGKRYHVSKHFYRYIRPGAERIELQYNEEDGVFATAWQHHEMGAFTIVAINTNSEPVELKIEGGQIPSQFDMYVTTSGLNTQKTEGAGDGKIVLPASAIVTLVHGNVYEHQN